MSSNAGSYYDREVKGHDRYPNFQWRSRPLRAGYIVESPQRGISPRSYAYAGRLRHRTSACQGDVAVNNSSINRIRLAEFLRSRRERLQPVGFGLPVFRRRRTNGLRRDDVAALADISLTYYTWIEQARELNLSREVVNNIAGALRFNSAERKYIATLAGVPANDDSDFGEKLHPTVAHILEGSSACARPRSLVQRCSREPIGTRGFFDRIRAFS